MTRKDYELIASLFSKHIDYYESEAASLIEVGFKAQAYGGAHALKDLATTFSYELQKTNPRFDRERFLKACFPPSEQDAIATALSKYGRVTERTDRSATK